MATKIVTKNSSTASAVPTASDLVQGELAVNVADKRLFTEDNAGAIVELGTNPSTLTVTGEITANGGIALGDNDKATFGTGDDLQIYHTGSQNYIEDAGTGNLNFKSNGNFYNFLDGSDATVFQIDLDDATRLYHNTAQKLATTSTGIDVTGTATMDGLTVKNPNVSGEQTILKIENAVNTGAIGKITFNQTDDRMGISNESSGSLSFDTATLERLNIASNGDISFYEDTGTTAKLFWDASAESLGIGTSSPQAPLHVAGNILCDAFNNGGAGNGLFFRKDFLVTTQPSITLKDHNGSSADGLSINAFDGISFSLNDSEKMRIDASGNVGIGVSSLNNPLEVGVTPNTASKTSGSAFDGAAIRLNGNLLTTNSEVAIIGGSDNGIQAGIGFVRESANDWGSAIKFYTRQAAVVDLDGIAERMRIDSSGRVGINNSSPVEMLTIGSTSDTNVRAQFISSTTGAGTIQFADGTGASAYSGYINYTHSDNALAFATSSTERMRIDSSGNLLVGATSQPSSFKMFVDSGANSSVGIRGSSTTYNAMVFYTPASATAGFIQVSGSTTSYNTSSDQRLKDNIVDAPSASDEIDAIQVRSFDWKADGEHQKYGMVAQELSTVAPEAVSGDADSEDMMGVDYSKLVPMLVKEIQSLRNRVAQLEE